MTAFARQVGRERTADDHILFRSAAMSLTASVIEDAEAPMIAETFCSLNQRPAMAVPTSGLFWSSAKTISIGWSPALPPASSAATLTPANRPGPVSSAYIPDISH